MSGDVPAHFFLVLCLVASRILPGGPVVQRPHDVPFCPDYARTICPVWIGARSSRFGMGVMDRRFSRAPIPMKGDRYALVAVRQRTTSVYDRPASVFRDEGGPTCASPAPLAASLDGTTRMARDVHEKRPGFEAAPAASGAGRVGRRV